MVPPFEKLTALQNRTPGWKRVDLGGWRRSVFRKCSDCRVPDVQGSALYLRGISDSIHVRRAPYEATPAGPRGFRGDCEWVP
eukprot:9246936-Pyramimonas_sp.AAC.1